MNYCITYGIVMCRKTSHRKQLAGCSVHIIHRGTWRLTLHATWTQTNHTAQQ